MATGRQHTGLHFDSPRPDDPRAERALQRQRRHAWVTLTVIALATMVVAGEAFGCPTCKDSLADGDAAAANLARGYFYSILLMLAMPFTLAGSFGLYVWREMRRQRPPMDDGGGSGSTLP